MKTKKVLPLISLLFVAIMLFSVGMIVKEHRERQQDIRGFEKLEEIITEVEQTEMTGNVEQTERPQEQKQSSRNLTPLFEANGDCIGWICIPNTAVNYPVTGGRIGEILGLRWEDCDFQDNIININHTLIYRKYTDEASHFAITTPKTKSGVRIIPMLSDVKAALRLLDF